jgi:hypothetical protein
MFDPDRARLAIFVQPRGTVLASVAGMAGPVGGLSGSLVATAVWSASVPVEGDQLAYLGVYRTHIVLFAARRRLVKPKATDDVILSMPRSAVQSAWVDASLGDALVLFLVDGTSWLFDVARRHLVGARLVACVLAPRHW